MSSGEVTLKVVRETKITYEIDDGRPYKIGEAVQHDVDDLMAGDMDFGDIEMDLIESETEILSIIVVDYEGDHEEGLWKWE